MWISSFFRQNGAALRNLSIVNAGTTDKQATSVIDACDRDEERKHGKS